MNKIEFGNQINALKNRLYRIAYLYRGIPQGTVVTRQRKALKLLKLELEED